ncbi:glycosyltransferase family 2 protein [Neobacillus vireti]|uniref:Beta-1,4-galactosyltransferase n=1 Tax=Neobacillus vireti LMG 21834 TaxID=1131730 RepID=A0AB94IKK0_9BACI|nr:glycosyltransferase family 2 protein [Neobacillus vireti]ETI67559.1 beta-1,4-galactosyltransferase [Neobacillus vireti LMG 21834]KLT18490.1 beta-1,4-galactosyltransferase [Neobacillus vireti]
MEPNKVSVVVPIYKVEKYLNRCVDSIINQTYSHLEIILINDGSPDKSGTIAEEYAKLDNRIKVIHKENGGLSDARNFGVQYVTGDFTLFVDSDDWIEVNMITELVHNSLKFKADVVQSAFYYAHQDHLLFDNRFYQKDDPPIILDNEALMAELVMNERVKNFAWGKLYKTEIIRDIPFKKGVLFEDVFWAHLVMKRVKTYLILHQPLCYYFQRGDSIVSDYSPRNLDIIKGLKERQIFIEEFYKNLSNESYKVLLKTIFIHYNLLLVNRKKDPKGTNKKELQIYIKKNYVKFINAAEKDNNLKKQLLLFSIHPYFNILFLFFRKLLRKFKIVPTPLGLEKINL